MNYLVIYPGRFHPFHLGHKASYDWLANQFGENNVYIASSNVQDPATSPFTFADKVTMATKLGIPSSHIVNVKNPYQATEITSTLTPEEKATTALIFAVSEKDASRFNFAPKKDGTPSYLQPVPKNKKSMKPMTKHGYVAITPTVNFRVKGVDANSASQIRKLYLDGNDSDRNQIITDLYGSPDSELRELFDQRLGVNQPQEAVTYGQEKIFAGNNPVSVMRERREVLLAKITEIREQLAKFRRLQINEGFTFPSNPVASEKIKKWYRSPASATTHKEKTFVSQGYTIKFLPNALEIYDGPELVYRKEGNYANPTKSQLTVARARIPHLIAQKKIQKASTVDESIDYIEEKSTRKK